MNLILTIVPASAFEEAVVLPLSLFTSLIGSSQYSSIPIDGKVSWTKFEALGNSSGIMIFIISKVGNFTDLKFIVKDLKSGNNLRNLTARITILSDNNNSVYNNLSPGYNLQNPTKLGNSTGISTVNINPSNGNIGVKHKFLNAGIYQVIVRANSDKYAMALASFDIYII